MLRLHSLSVVGALAAFLIPTTGWTSDPPLAPPQVEETVEGSAEKPELPPTWYEELVGALEGGTVHVNLRLRAEYADADGLRGSNAYTGRLRLGYGTAEFQGWSLFADFEDSRALTDRNYNAAGLNGHPTKTFIDDPEHSELNQGYVSYWRESAATEVRVGRQRIVLDDERFVGDNDWRQNQQTFDAVSVTNTSVENVELQYVYLWEVHRSFGDQSSAAVGTTTRDFEADSHLFNVSYMCDPLAKLTAFAYILDFSGPNTTAPANSSNTYGARLTGRAEISEQASIGYTGSYALQVDGEDNPAGYKANYFFAEGNVDMEELGEAFVGLEYLGSNHGRAQFRTPLADAHGFNGWADSFLADNGGPTGLQDFYIGVAPDLPCELVGAAIWHKFNKAEGGGDLGWELDARVGRKLTDNVMALIKCAYFDGHAGFSDIWRFWTEVTLEF